MGSRRATAARSRASTQLVETLFKSGATASIGDSLKTAQSQMITNPDTSHPYYWGAFALVGDGRAFDACPRLPDRTDAQWPSISIS